MNVLRRSLSTTRVTANAVATATANSTASVTKATPRKLKFGNDIKLRPPIVPTHQNMEINPNHPLWQFFPNGNESTPLRESEELDLESREWTMNELRRKSFDDLHKIWYLTLKQRNILAREARLAETLFADNSKFNEVDAKLINVQKRIKNTLLERQVAYERAQLLQEKQQEYLNEFKTRFINCENSEADEYYEKLIRLQYAFFGIKPDIKDFDLDQDINIRFVEGLKYIADVKLSRYLKMNPNVEFKPLIGPMEELPFLLNDVEDALSEVETLRQEGKSVVLQKIQVLPFLRNAIGNVLQSIEQEEQE